jgi:hypothetical protein
MFVFFPYIIGSDKNRIMENVLLKTRKSLFTDSRFQHAKLLNFDLPILIKKMKKSISWASGELNAIILLKSRYKQIVLTSLHEDTQIESFQSHDSVTLQIIEGKLNFYTRKEFVTLSKGQLLTLSEKLNYSLTSLEETVFLLTIIKNTLPVEE